MGIINKKLRKNLNLKYSLFQITSIHEESLNLDSIVKLTVFLVDLSDFDLLNEQFIKYFGHEYPSRSVVEVSRLPKDVKIEIEAICCYDK